MKRPRPLLTLLLATLLALPAAAAEGEEASAAALKQKIHKLEKLAEGYTRLHRQLEINRDETFALHQRAEENLQGNILKVYIKGSLEIYNRITTPTNALLDTVLEMGAEIALNIAVEPAVWSISQDRVALLGLGREAARESDKLRILYDALGQVMAADASRFDDDAPAMAYTQSWWGEPDDTPDDEIERVTRKLNVVRNLSLKVYERTEAELARVRDRRHAVLSELEALRPRHARQMAAEEQLNRDMVRWRESQARRARPSAAVEGDDRGPGAHEGRRPDATLPAEQQARWEVLQEQRRREAEARRLEEQTRQAREAEATVYIPAEIPRACQAGEAATFHARIEPAEVKGTLIWRLDDKVIGRGALLRHTFPREAVHDLSVSLEIRGRLQDRYVDRITVSPAAKLPHRVAYAPELEGKEIKALDLPCCHYAVRHENGRVVITGHYLTAAGQKVPYTSEPLKHYPTLPPAGMFALPDGTGYHVYLAAESDFDDAETYIVTRMKGAEVKALHRLKVKGRFDMKPAADWKSWTLRYTEQVNGPERSVVLR